MNTKRINKLIMEYAAMEMAEVKENRHRGFMLRALIIATMPHRKPNGTEFKRMNGGYTLTMSAPSEAGGLPHGKYARLAMAGICTETVIKKNRILHLGSTSAFMKRNGLMVSGGPNGSLPRMRDQIRRLMNSSVSLHFHNEDKNTDVGFRLSSRIVNFWDAGAPQDMQKWETEITLSEEFYREVIEHAVPIDLKALQALKDSSLAMDIYMWLTHRMFDLKKPIDIPWVNLSFQFGSDFSRTVDFKRKFILQLKKVLKIYPVNVTQWEAGLTLKPSSTHILK